MGGTIKRSVGGPLEGRTVGITDDRRWNEQAELFRKRGAHVMHGPTLRTVDLSSDEVLRQVTEDLVEHPPDYLVVTTGMGMRMWLGATAAWGMDQALKDALASRTRILV